MKQCTNTPEENKKELLREYHAEKKRQKEKAEKDRASTRAVRDEAGADIARHSSLFRACFAQKSEHTICADSGSDINLLPPTVLRELQEVRAEMTVVMLPAPRSSGLAVKDDPDGKEVRIVCDRMVTLDVQLFIRHGTSLWLRNITWYVATQNVTEPLLGRPVLHALGFNAEETLAAASAMHHGSVDVSQLRLEPEDLPEGSVARIMAKQGMFHQSGSEDDTEHDVIPDSEFGIDTKEDIDNAFDNLVKSASENGCPDPVALRGLLEKHRSVFRCKLGPYPPALVEPMKIQLYPEAKGIFAKPRQYSTEQRRTIDDFMTRAVSYGFMTTDTEASWTSPPLLVPKPRSTDLLPAYRLAFDLRAVNAVTIPMSWPLPNVDSELADLRGKVCYALIDFVSSYWQAPLHYSCRHLHAVVTPTGVFAPTRTLQGGRNSAANFQAKVEPCFAEIRDSLKAWLDNFLLHARSWDDLFRILGRFFTICAEKRLLVSAKKSTLFTTTVKWCGRVIDKNGTRMDPRHLDGLLNSAEPETADEVSQFVNCAQWMSSNIPEFAARIKPLRDLVERAYEQAGRRTSKAISRIKTRDLAWGSEHTSAMHSIQESLKSAVSLAHYDPKKALCIYTDASDQHWAAVVTQCDKTELAKDHEEQKHSPMGFLGSEFKGSELNWSTIEKEGFAIFSVFKKMDYLLMGSDETHVYTDHRNLLFVFHPTAIEPGLGRHVVSKLQRWALFLSQFSYHINHVSGAKNVMADMMTRWYKGYRGKRDPAMARRVVASNEKSRGNEDGDSSLWPTPSEIRESQLRHSAEERPKNGSVIDNVYRVNGRLWIPSADHELQIRILTLSHCGQGGHRGADATESAVKEAYTWQTLKADFRQFIDRCLHCLTASSGEKSRVLSQVQCTVNAQMMCFISTTCTWGRARKICSMYCS